MVFIRTAWACFNRWWPGLISRWPDLILPPLGPISGAEESAMVATIGWISLLVLALVCGHYTARHAAKGGRSKPIWFVCGAVLFPLFPLPWFALDLMPRK